MSSYFGLNFAHPRSPISRSAVAFVMASFLPFLGSPPLSGQDVSYSIVPTYEEVRWDDAFGLERARLLGVRASVDFGPFFSLQPFYAWKDEVEIREGLTPTGGAEVAELFDVKAFGADVQVNLLKGPLVPFIRGGGGVLRTEDEVEDRRDRIFLRYGGGLRFGLGERAGAELYAENWGTRLASPFVPGAVAEADFPEDGIVNSMVYGAGVRIPFGGGYRDTEGVPGILPGFYLEPYAARIDFSDELRLDRQYLGGVRAGVDLNQNVGLRGFVWRGVDEDFSEWMELEGYGAEAQFALNTGPGLNPFVVLGAGRIEFKDEFRDLDDQPRGRQNHLTLGGGIAIGLGDRTRVELGARNLLMSVNEELEDITSPDELVSNWQYSAGLSVSLGAQPRTAAQRAADRERTVAERERARYEAELEALRRENLRLRAGEDPARVERVQPVQRVEMEVDTLRGTRTMTIPVPEVGEVILRYGAEYAGGRGMAVEGMSAEELAALERRIEEVLLTRGLMAPSDTAQARLQRELLEARLPEMVRQVVREEMGRMGVQPTPAVAPPAPAPTGTFMAGRRIMTFVPFSGMQVSSPTQVLLGARADIGLISELVPLSLLPEVSFGVGEGDPTLRVALNTRFGWNLGGSNNITPYGQFGLGISNRRFLSADLAYGAVFDVPRETAAPWRVFVEHRGISWYRDHQLLVGLQLAR